MAQISDKTKKTESLMLENRNLLEERDAKLRTLSRMEAKLAASQQKLSQRKAEVASNEQKHVQLKAEREFLEANLDKFDTAEDTKEWRLNFIKQLEQLRAQGPQGQFVSEDLLQRVLKLLQQPPNRQNGGGMSTQIKRQEVAILDPSEWTNGRVFYEGHLFTFEELARHEDDEPRNYRPQKRGGEYPCPCASCPKGT